MEKTSIHDFLEQVNFCEYIVKHIQLLLGITGIDCQYSSPCLIDFFQRRHSRPTPYRRLWTEKTRLYELLPSCFNVSKLLTEIVHGDIMLSWFSDQPCGEGAI